MTKNQKTMVQRIKAAGEKGITTQDLFQNFPNSEKINSFDFPKFHNSLHISLDELIQLGAVEKRFGKIYLTA